MLRLTNVRIKARAATLLAIDELDVRDSEILVVLGATGAGKSTLLRVMNTLQKPDQGELFWQGQQLGRSVPLAIRRQMVMAFQDPLLFSGTVFDNVAFGLRLRGVTKKAAKEKITEILRLFRIEDIADRSVKTLSGGEAQRTALARAVVLRPKLLLLDEPLASLDAATRESLRGELKGIIRRLGLSAVFVTHDQHEAAVLADRVALMDKGKILQIGTMEDLFYRPANLSIAQFVRIGNILPARVVGLDGELAVIDCGGQRLGIRAEVPVGTATTLFIRPEQIDIAKGNGHSGELGSNCMVGTVAAVTQDGLNTRVSVDCGVIMQVDVRRTITYSVGEAVVLHIHKDGAHLILASEEK